MNIDPGGYWLIPLSVPLLAAICQWIYPTIIAWILIFLPTAGYAIYLVAVTLKYEGVERDTSGTVLNWIFIVYLLLVCLLLLRVWPSSVESRRHLGLCQACGYNLTANTSGVCPECGTPVPAPAGEKPPA